MILVPISVFALQQVSPVKSSFTGMPVQIAKDSSRVVEFARLAITNQAGVADAKVLADAKPVRVSDWDIRGMRAYRVGEMYFWVDANSGLVTVAEGGSDHSLDRPSRPRYDASGSSSPMPVPRRITDENAISLAKRYFAATGRSYPVQVLDIRDGAGGNGDDIALTLQPSYRGVSFGASVQIEIDRETGRLDSFSLYRELPTPPLDVTPATSDEVAHDIALRAAANAGRAVKDLPAPFVRLTIVRLDSTPSRVATYNFNQIDREDAQAGRGRLVYDVRVRGLWDGAQYTALVDAKNGRLLQVHRNKMAGFEAAKDTIASLPETLKNARAWRFAEGDAPWSKPVIDTLVPALSEGFAGTRKVLLTDGKSAFLADYDPVTGRIGIEGADKKMAVYQPGPALTELLKKSPAASPKAG